MFHVAQFVALEEENKRRRDECIQLRSILAQRSHIFQHKNEENLNSSGHNNDEHILQEIELIQAFEAQKMVNRQLESELTALTEANNHKIYDMSQEIDKLRNESNQFHEILYNQIKQPDGAEEQIDLNKIDDNLKQQNQQNIAYLMHEVKSISADYADVLVCIQFIRS